MQEQEFSIDLARPALRKVLEGAGVDRCHVDQKFYRIHSTRRGSDWYGVCEICGKRADVVHVYTHWDIAYSKLSKLPSLQQRYGGSYGHLSCLETQIKANAHKVVFSRDLK